MDIEKRTFVRSNWCHIGIFWLIISFVAIGPIHAPFALALGILTSLFIKNPIPQLSRSALSPLLGCAIIGLGARMDLSTISHASTIGIATTFFTITFTLLFSYLLGRALAIDPHLSLLLGVGTAICGGSAIAATAASIRAKPNIVSIALGIVFILNACALFLFPKLGHAFSLDQNQFGIFSALAIHDTSSVIASSLSYGPEALTVATAIKLVRALWIAPVVFTLGLIMNSNHPSRRFYFPWFVIGFVAMVLLTSFIPSFTRIAPVISTTSNHLLVIALFFTGLNISLGAIRSIGVTALIHAIILWTVVTALSLLAIKLGILTL